MKNTLYNVGFYGLLMGAAIFLGLTIWEVQGQQARQQQKEQTNQRQHQTIPVDFDRLLADLNYYSPSSKVSKQANYLALFILNAKNCIPCLNEVHEYIRLINARPETQIRPVVVVAIPDSAEAMRFLRTANYPASAFFGTSHQLNNIAALQNNVPIYQLMVLVNVTTQQVTHRKILPNRITTPSSKELAINEMLLNPNP